MSSPRGGWGGSPSTAELAAAAGISESTGLLQHECSTPIRHNSPPPPLPFLKGKVSRTPGSSAISDQRPLSLPTGGQSLLLSSSDAASPARSVRTVVPATPDRERTFARRLSAAGAGHAFDTPMSLHPSHAAPRRVSNASLLRSRSISNLNEDDHIGGDASKMSKSRLLALAAVCTLSIGSHFTTYLLGPLKSRLKDTMGTSNSQFSLLVSALNLNSTWLPLVAGILVARFGTTWSSVAVTGSVLLGAAICYYGIMHKEIAVMALGLFTFGIGHTPQMVVQETLIARLSPGGHLGLSLALGLVSGKTASWISATVSLPLAELGGDGAPFFVAMTLCTVSFVANIARIVFRWGEAWTRDGTGKKNARVLKWDGLGQLGDVFWVYIALNILCGFIWQPFLHLSANLIQTRYGLSQAEASWDASILLAGAIGLYPIVGYVTDRYGPHTPRTTFQLLAVTSVFTLGCYTWLALPVEMTRSPRVGMVMWAIGHGASTLLLVVLIPRILPAPLVPLGLGIHKALETCASTMFQTFAGLWLDWAKEHFGGQEAAAHSLVLIFLGINIAQLLLTLYLWQFERTRRHECDKYRLNLSHAEEYERVALDPSSEQAIADDGDPDDYDYRRDHSNRTRRGSQSSDASDDSLLLPSGDTTVEPEGPQSGVARSDSEKARGKLAFRASLGFIVFVWVLWIGAAISRL